MEKTTVIYVLVCLIFHGLLAFAGNQSLKRPNIVLFITDDQDVMLNSMSVMNHTRDRITNKGIHFSNAFTTTPMCCPSRSSILTGLYTHNHHVYTNNDNCSSILWRRFHESRSFATYLNNSGYQTGYFGKYLNEYNGSYTPSGWDYWMGLVKNSKYYNYTLLHNGQREVHGDNYAKDYLTDLVANRSMDYFRDSKLEDPDRPVLSVISFPAPHGPEDAAPQYQHLYNNTDPDVTKSFNYAPNPDKHWIIQRIQEKMDETQLRFSQLLQQKRLQTLRSVDDNIKKFTDMLQEMNELDNTYIMYFSDHGYHIGQFGLAKGKSQPYDFDIRIPFLMRGPRLPQNVTIPKIALNIDIAPTVLGMAGVPVPSDMDGRNLMDMFDERKLESRPWRDSFLVERGKMPRDRAHLVKPRLQREKKMERLKKVCALPNYKNPCEVGQIWTCTEEPENKLRLQKCKKEKKQKRKKFGGKRKKLCPCTEPPKPAKFDVNERANDIPLNCEVNRQKGRKRVKRVHYAQFQGGPKKLKQAYSNFRKNNPGRGHKRSKRNVPAFDVGNAHQNRSLHNKAKSMILTSRCRLYMPNFEIRCLENLYNDPREWVRHMGHLAKSVRMLQIRMKYMKTLQSCLNSFGENMKRAQIPMCDCPTPPPKPPGTKAATTGNFSHPLIVGHKTEQDLHLERVREFKEQKSTIRLIKEVRQAKVDKIQRRKEKGNFRMNKCGEKGVTCFKMSNHTWRTEPKWNGPSQCYCTNSNNNTYWCVRIINSTTNILYCEFITHFIEYYDLNKDPDQLLNQRNEMSDEMHNALHSELSQLRGCKGVDNCTIKRLPPVDVADGQSDMKHLESIQPRTLDPVQGIASIQGEQTPNFPGFQYKKQQAEQEQTRRPTARPGKRPNLRKQQASPKVGRGGRRSAKKSSTSERQKKQKTQQVQKISVQTAANASPQETLETQKPRRYHRQRQNRRPRNPNSQTNGRPKKNRKKKTSLQ